MDNPAPLRPVEGFRFAVINGNIDKQLKNLKRAMGEDGRIQRIKDLEAFVPPSQARKLKSIRAAQTLARLERARVKKAKSSAEFFKKEAEKDKG